MTTNQPHPRLHDDEVAVDDALVRRLVDRQFPHWSGLSLDRVRSTGTDNAIYRLGDDMGLRLPRIHWAVAQVAKEWDWLPTLGPQLPIPVPMPLAKGQPGSGYPHPWLVSPWIAGDDLQHTSGFDLNHAARAIAELVVALRKVRTTGNPPQGARAGSLTLHDERARWAIARVAGTIDAERAEAVWEAALRAGPWTKPAVWTHGDLLAANIIVNDGRVVGVIDWSCAGIGDPACDAQVAWFLPPEPRAVFREVAQLDEATWARARGWVVWQTATFISSYAATIPDAVASATLRLQAVLEEP